MRATRSADQAADRVALGILAAIGVIAALTFRDYGLGWDDYTHSEYGELLLALYGSGFNDTRALSFVNLYKYGGGFDMAAALLAKISPFELFETRRLLGAVVGIIGLAATWRLGRRVGGPVAGTAALILLATCPLYYGHMFMNAKDAPFATAMTILLIGIVRSLGEYPKPSPITVLLFGLGLGLSFGSRILGMLAIFYVLGGLLLMLAEESRNIGFRAAGKHCGQFVWRLLPAAAIGYLIMALLWPWSVINPLNPIYAAIYFADFFEKPWKELYEGALIAVPNMPASYAMHLFALKLPEIMLALGIGGALIALASIVRRDAPLPQRASMLAIMLAAFLPIGIATATHPAFYNGIRQFVFDLPPLAVLGGLCASWLIAVSLRRSFAACIAIIAVFIAALASPVSDLVRLHPYEYTAFNRLAGGVRGARPNYMLDYWGLSFKQASEELRATLAAKNQRPPTGRRWIVAVCGPQRGPQVALGPDFQTTAESRGADFAMMLGEFYCRNLDAPVLATVEREGVVYARVYDIRGRNVTRLLTQPPP